MVRLGFISALFVFSICLVGLSGLASPVEGQNAVKVMVEPVREKEVLESVTLVGTAKSRKRSKVASQVEGWVEEIFFEDGDLVKQGQPLARLEGRSLRIQLDGAKAALQEAEARLAQAEADLVRLSALWESKSIAEKALQDAQFEANARKQRVNVLHSQMEHLKDKLSKKEIRAPFAGWVAEQHVEVGEWVDPGGAVATLVDLSEIHIEVPMPERYVPALRVGEPVDVTLDAFPDKTFPGKVHSINPYGEAQARTFDVEVAVPNPDNLILAGMLARATLSAGAAHKALLIPKDALVLSESNRAVFVVNDQKAHRVPVEIVAFHGDAIEVEGELQPGALVVVIGNERLRDGQSVEVAPSSMSDRSEEPK